MTLHKGVGGGRPTKLTPELQAKIVSAIAAGNYMETAAAYAGISRDSLYEWLKRGRKERLRIEAGMPKNRRETRYAEFSEAVEKSMAQAEVADIAVIGMAAASGQWQAAAWRLERKYPEKYGRRDRMELSAASRSEIEGGKTEHYDLSKITDPEKLRMLLQILSEAGDVTGVMADSSVRSQIGDGSSVEVVEEDDEVVDDDVIDAEFVEE